MHVLQEHEVRASLRPLDAAWEDRSTFAFVPEKSGVTLDWVRERLPSLPPSLQTDHFLLLTSGSTGTPKLVVANRRRAEALTRVLHDRQALEPVATAIVALPLTYCYALVNQWLWARVHGRGVLLSRGLGYADILMDQLETTRDSMICLVGSQLSLLRCHWAGRQFPHVRRVNFAGGPFPQADLPLVAALFPAARIFNNYGCAEAMPRLTVREADPEQPGEQVGPPLPGVELRSGPDGEVLFRSPYQIVAEFVDGEFRAIADDAWLPAGDLGELDPAGRLHLRGRGNEVFKRYGEKVSLPTILAAVRELWPEGAACFRETDKRGEPGHVLVLAAQPDDAGIKTLLAMFRTRFSRSAWPLRIESLPALPTLANGKPDVLQMAASQDKTVHWQQRT